MPKSNVLVRAGVGLMLLIVIATAIVLYWRRENRDRQIILSGTIEAHSVRVGSLTGGRVIDVRVREGDRTAPRQVLATLETDQIERQTDEQKAAIEIARAQLEKVMKGPRSDEVRKAQAIYENAERERRRHAELLEQGVISRQLYDDVATRARTAESDLSNLRKGSRDEEIEAARAQLEREQRRLEMLLEQRTESVIESSVAGTVQSIGIRPGDLVAPNQGTIEIVEEKDMWVRVFVPETLLGLVRLQMPVKVKVDTFPDKEYDGSVIQINSEAEYTPRNVQTRTQRAEQVFGIKVRLSPNPDLKPGMAADVDLGVRGRS